MSLLRLVKYDQTHPDFMTWGEGCWVVPSDWMGQWFNTWKSRSVWRINFDWNFQKELQNNFPMWNNLHFGANALKIIVSIVFISWTRWGRAQQDLSLELRSTNLEFRYVLNWSQVEGETAFASFHDFYEGVKKNLLVRCAQARGGK